MTGGLVGSVSVSSRVGCRRKSVETRNMTPETRRCTECRRSRHGDHSSGGIERGRTRRSAMTTTASATNRSINRRPHARRVHGTERRRIWSNRRR